MTGTTNKFSPAASQSALPDQDQLLQLFAPYVEVMEQFIATKNGVLAPYKDELPAVKDLLAFPFSQAARGRVSDVLQRKDDEFVLGEYYDGPRNWNTDFFGDHTEYMSRAIISIDAAQRRRMRERESFSADYCYCTVTIDRSTQAVSLRINDNYGSSAISSPENLRRKLEDWFDHAGPYYTARNPRQGLIAALS